MARGRLRGRGRLWTPSTLLGLAAFTGGLTVVLWASTAGLAVLVAAMAVPWAVSTAHHVLPTKELSRPVRPGGTAPHDED